MTKFNMCLDSFEVFTLRSSGSDSDSVGFAISVNNGPPQIQQWHRDQIWTSTYDKLGLVFEGVELGEHDVVCCAYTIVNCGNSDKRKAVTDQILYALLSKGAEGVGSFFGGPVGVIIADVLFGGIWSL